LYEPGANLTQIVIQQHNLTGSEMEDNEPAGRILYVYPHPNCKLLSTEDGGDGPQVPWYSTTCQTSAEGDCHTVPQGIQSFAIFRTEEMPDKCDDWRTWKTGNDASMSTRKSIQVVGGLAAMVALWVML
jgi:hypothetical protein